MCGQRLIRGLHPANARRILCAIVIMVSVPMLTAGGCGKAIEEVAVTVADFQQVQRAARAAEDVTAFARTVQLARQVQAA
jgi:hypothetical protein